MAVAVPDIDEIRGVIAERGTNALAVDDLTAGDLPRLAWSGGGLHVKSVARALDRVGRGEVEYLTVRAPDGAPVAKGGIDYDQNPGSGTLWQLATAGELQGLGLGSRLIAEGERRIRRRGLERALLGVENDNVRARALYERLGYAVCGHDRSSWEAEGADGRRYTHHAELTLLCKRLAQPLVVPRGIVALVGAPGAGKSAFAAALVRLGTIAPADVCSSDAVSEERYGPGDSSEHDDEIFGERARRIRVRIEAGHAALADSTNVRAEARAGLVAQARELGVPASALRFPVLFDTLRRQHRERGKRTVPIEPFYELMREGIAAGEGFAAIHDVPGSEQGATATAAAMRVEIG